jgi:glycosyltransferase involved in cell wall biosynthesis
MHELPLVSVVVPCRNERDHIEECLDSIISSDYSPDRLEILVVDGMSDDGTRDILASYAASQVCVTVVDNPDRITPCALNVGIRAARGDILVRMDAHASFPPDYITRLTEWLLRSGADNVGGVCETIPASDAPVARAIARALSHPLGVGNAYFRIGVSEPRWVDTVPFGCYRREVFGRVGFFDEELVRNQDDEFNHRLLAAGGRILLVPDVVSTYRARGTLRQLGRMYYQYGYFKPLAVRKLGHLPTVRQLAPAALVLGFISTALLSPSFGLMRVGFAALALSYAVPILAAAAATRGSLAFRAALAAALPVLHFSYGIGYLRGAVRFLLFRKRSTRMAAAVPLSR